MSVIGKPVAAYVDTSSVSTNIVKDSLFARHLI